MNLEDLTKIKCPACGKDDAYFSFVGGVSLNHPTKLGGTAQVEIAPNFDWPGATTCRHCLADRLPKVDGATLSVTVDL